MEIKVLGSGCANCKKLLQVVQSMVKELAVSADVLYVTDYVEIVKTGIMRTPGLMINGKIVSYGRVPSSDEVKTFIQNEM